jgi:DNA repair photolyase
MPSCGSQIILCDLPIRFDTYSGCSHACDYCFANAKKSIKDISVFETVESLSKFIEGKRNIETIWCDWEIPLHIGGMSDPFQPCESHFKVTYNCLLLLKETQYPFVISSKGRLFWDDVYLEILKDVIGLFKLVLLMIVLMFWKKEHQRFKSAC